VVRVIFTAFLRTEREENAVGKTIKLPCFGIIVNLTGDGGGAISSDLHEEQDENVEGGSEEDTAHEKYEGAIDGIEAMILGHAVAGVDIETPAYIEGIEAAVQACGANI
jgi:hypothetical protein